LSAANHEASVWDILTTQFGFWEISILGGNIGLVFVWYVWSWKSER